MFFESANSCCGIAEIRDMFDSDKYTLDDCKQLVKEAFHDGDWGMLICWFAKQKGERRYEGKDILDHFKKLGFKTLKEVNNPHHKGNKLLTAYLRKEDVIKKKWYKSYLKKNKNWKKELKAKIKNFEKENKEIIDRMNQMQTLSPEEWHLIDQWDEWRNNLEEGKNSEPRFGPGARDHW